MTTTASSISTPNRKNATSTDPLHRLYATPTNATKQQRWLVDEELEKRTQRRGSTPSSANDPLHRLYSTPTNATKNQNWKAHQDNKQKEKKSLVWGVDNAKVEHLKQKLAAPLSEQLQSQIQNATMKTQKFLKDERKVKSNNGIDVWGVDKTAIAKAERLKKTMAPISENLENHIQNATSQRRHILHNQRKKEKSSVIKVWGVDKNALAKAERLKQRLTSPSEQLESHIKSATSRQRQILDNQKEIAKEKTLDIWGVDKNAIAQANRLKSNVIPPSVATRGKGKGKFRAASMAVRTTTKNKTVATKKKIMAKTTKTVTSPARVSARKRLTPKKTKKKQQPKTLDNNNDLFGDVLDAILNDDDPAEKDKNDVGIEKELTKENEDADEDTEALIIATTAADKILEATSAAQNPAVDATSKVNEIQNTVDEIRDALNEIRNAVNESNALADKNSNDDSRPPEVIVVKHNHEADTVATAGLTLDDSLKGGVEESKEVELMTGKEIEDPLMLVEEEEEEDQIFDDDEEESEFEDENIENIPTSILSPNTSSSYGEVKGSVIDSIESKFSDSVLTHQPELLQSWSSSIPPPPRASGSIVVSSPHASPVIHLKQKPSSLLLSCSVPTSDDEDEDEDDYDDFITIEKAQKNVNKKKKKTKNPLKKLWKKVQ